MYDLSEAELGWARISAIVERAKVVHDVSCANCNRIEETTFWLAVLGWTPDAFMVEAYPEFYGTSRG